MISHALTPSFYTAVEVARILHCDPQLLREQAHRDPCALGFPVVVIGRRVRIPRTAFMRYLEGHHGT